MYISSVNVYNIHAFMLKDVPEYLHVRSCHSHHKGTVCHSEVTVYIVAAVMCVDDVVAVKHIPRRYHCHGNHTSCRSKVGTIRILVRAKIE